MIFREKYIIYYNFGSKRERLSFEDANKSNNLDEIPKLLKKIESTRDILSVYLENSKKRIQIRLGVNGIGSYNIEIHDGKIAGIYYKDFLNEKEILAFFKKIKKIIKSPDDFDFKLEYW